MLLTTATLIFSNSSSFSNTNRLCTFPSPCSTGMSDASFARRGSLATHDMTKVTGGESSTKGIRRGFLHHLGDLGYGNAERNKRDMSSDSPANIHFASTCQTSVVHTLPFSFNACTLHNAAFRPCHAASASASVLANSKSRPPCFFVMVFRLVDISSIDASDLQTRGKVISVHPHSSIIARSPTLEL